MKRPLPRRGRTRRSTSSLTSFRSTQRSACPPSCLFGDAERDDAQEPCSAARMDLYMGGTHVGLHVSSLTPRMPSTPSGRDEDESLGMT